MKVARVVEGVLQVQDVPMPTPGNEEALIRITASGVCHSDVHIQDGYFALAGSGVSQATAGAGHAERLARGSSDEHFRRFNLARAHTLGDGRHVAEVWNFR